jgi:hypothetical protein
VINLSSRHNKSWAVVTWRSKALVPPHSRPASRQRAPGTSSIIIFIIHALLVRVKTWDSVGRCCGPPVKCDKLLGAFCNEQNKALVCQDVGGGITRTECVRSEVVTTVEMSMLILWVVTTSGLVDRYRRFGETRKFVSTVIVSAKGK